MSIQTEEYYSSIKKKQHYSVMCIKIDRFLHIVLRTISHTEKKKKHILSLLSDVDDKIDGPNVEPLFLKTERVGQRERKHGETTEQRSNNVQQKNI